MFMNDGYLSWKQQNNKRKKTMLLLTCQGVMISLNVTRSMILAVFLDGAVNNIKYEGSSGLQPGTMSTEPGGIWTKFRLIFMLNYK